MSHRKAKRYDIWIDGEGALPQEISQLLPKLILQMALYEDVTGPMASGVERDKYIAELAPCLREPISRELRQSGLMVSDEELARICFVAACETFVIRRLCEARLEGEVLVEDFNHLPIYETYKDYFEQSPRIVAQAFSIAINAAAFGWAARREKDSKPDI